MSMFPVFCYAGRCTEPSVMKTEDLMTRLAREVRPVRRLRRPWLRATMWVAATTIYLAAFVLFMAPPGRLGAALVDLRSRSSS